MSDSVTVEIKPNAPPSQAVKVEAMITTPAGQALKLRPPDILAQFALIEGLGKLASNDTYVKMSMPLLFIETLDGEKVTVITQPQVKALLKRLGNDGYEALVNGMAEHFGENNADEEAERALIKK